jgi:secretion/DNA translocation related CpaE-like protein
VGRLSPAALVDALPCRDGLSVLSWDRGPAVDLPLAAVASVLDAAVRGFDIVIVDAPRCAADTVREALRRATATFLVVPCEFRAVAAAQRVLLSIGPSGAPVRLVTRGPSPSGLDPHWVATSLGLELVADLRHDGRVAAAVERGEPLPDRGSLTKVADAVLDTAVTGYGAP